MCFTAYSNYAGWVALGVGEPHLHGSDVYMGWTNSTGGIQLSNLKGTSEYIPDINEVQNAIPVPLIHAVKVKVCDDQNSINLFIFRVLPTLFADQLK